MTLYATSALSLPLLAGVMRGGRALALAPDRLVLEVEDLRLRFRPLPEGEVAAHVEGVCGLVIEPRVDASANLEPVFRQRLETTRHIYLIDIEPADRPAGRTLALTVARLVGGVLFDGRAFVGSTGQRLARLSTEPPFEATPKPDDGRFAEPPHAERVVLRAWALLFASWRAAHDGGPDEAKATALRKWLSARAGLVELEPEERAVLDAPWGQVPPDAARRAKGFAPGAEVLAWALAAGAQPSHDTVQGADLLAARMGFGAPSRPAPLDPPRLRSSAEFEWLARRTIAMHWRFREFWLAPGKVDFRAFARTAWVGAFDLIGINLADDDLAIDGAPMPRASRARVGELHAAAIERHRAIGWLRGAHVAYHQVRPTL